MSRKTTRITFPVVTLFLLLTIGTTATCPAQTDKPNVVIIYGDDVGYSDVGVYGSTMIPTPNIDRLAAEGIRFTDGHCSAATCTPSRFSLLTGVHAFRDEIRILPPDAPLCFSTNIITLPEIFKKAGYATGVIGKWHLGLGSKGVPTDWNGEVKPGPLETGFDFSFLLPSTNDRVPCTYLLGHRVLNLNPADPLFVGESKASVDRPGSTPYPDGKKNREAMTYYQSSHGHEDSVINGIGRIGYMAGGKSALWNDETMTDVFVEQARAYISANKNKPFFLFFSSQNIHAPRTPNSRFRGKTNLSYRGDAMVEFDWATGEIMKALDDNGISKNTIVIFSSDNGPVYDDGYKDGTTIKTFQGESDRGHDASGIWRGGKYQVYEGGTRVPFIVRWPERIKPGVSAALVNQIDLLASFAALLNVDLPDGEARDSRNILATLLGEEMSGLPFMVEEANKALALRVGNWKYIRNQKPNVTPGNKSPSEELYNLASDPGEAKNLIGEHKDLARDMAGQLEKIVNGKGIRITEAGH